MVPAGTEQTVNKDINWNERKEKIRQNTSQTWLTVGKYAWRDY